MPTWKRSDESLPFLISCIRITSKWIKDLNAKKKKKPYRRRRRYIFIIVRVEKAFLTMIGIQKLFSKAGIFVSIKILSVC